MKLFFRFSISILNLGANLRSGISVLQSCVDDSLEVSFSAEPMKIGSDERKLGSA